MLGVRGGAVSWSMVVLQDACSVLGGLPLLVICVCRTRPMVQLYQGPGPPRPDLDRHRLREHTT